MGEVKVYEIGFRIEEFEESGECTVWIATGRKIMLKKGSNATYIKEIPVEADVPGVDISIT